MHTSHASPLFRPAFITFTGADDHTDIDRMVVLSRRYPIEWAILFSPKLQGQGRYPNQEFIERVTNYYGLRLAAHLCGQHSRDVLERGVCRVSLTAFERCQINSASPSIDLCSVAIWAKRNGVQPILQTRNPSDFPLSTAVSWLYDPSGGHGMAPAVWPAQHPSASCGYAGGIGPHNVLDVLSRIAPVSSSYWIDMESGVRDENDRFSLDKCEAVCQAVYG